MAGGTIGSLAVNVVANTGGFSKGLGKARGDAKAFENTLGALKGAVAGFGAAFAANFSLGKLKETAEDMDRINRTAKRLGTTTQALGGLEFAAGIADVKLESLSQGLTKYEVGLGKAIDGSSEAAAPFERLGLNIKSLADAPADQALGRIADKINALPTAAQRAAAAAGIFGKQAGPELQSLLSEGSVGINKLMDEAKSLGITFGQDVADKVDKAGDAMDRMKLAVGGLSRELTALGAPAAEKAANFGTGLVKELNTALGNRDAESDPAARVLGKLSDENFKKFAKQFRSRSDVKAELAAEQKAWFTIQPAKLNLGGQDMSITGMNKAIDQRFDAMSQNRAATMAKRENLSTNTVGRLGAALGDGASQLGTWLNKGSEVLGKGLSKFDDAQSGALKNGLLNAFLGGDGDTGIGKKAADSPTLKRMIQDPLETLHSGAALEKGTAAAFSQERRSAQQNKMVDIAQKQLTTQTQMAKSLAKLESLNNLPGIEAADF